MPKLPFMRFFPADYLLATRALTDTEKAIWMDLLCYMWLQPLDRGRLEMHVEDMARMVGRDRLTLAVTLNALRSKGVCDLKERPDQVVFVECRRMVRDQKQLSLTNNRVKRFNASINAKLTPKKSEDRSQKTDKDSIVEPAAPTPKPLTDIQRIVRAFKQLQGYDKEDKAWDKLNFPRCTKSAKAILEFIGNWGDAIDCVQDVYERLTGKGLTVTLETVTKHAAEWKKNKLEKGGLGNGVLFNPGNGNRPLATGPS